MSFVCSFDGCLYAEQQVCARNGSPTPCEFAQDVDTESEDLVASEEEPTPSPLPKGITSSLLAPDENVGLFHTGQELGLLEVGPMMEEQYTHLMAILGDHKAGKTSFLVCLYLAAACGMLDELHLSFAGSMTLPGFEARARSSRKWSATNPPDRMTERTVVGEGRGAGFLHFDLVKTDTNQRLRLLMSDLPGEWTKEFVDHQRHSHRLNFLNRADSVLIMIDGEQLVGGSRHVEVDRNQILIDRLAELLGKRRPTLRFIATRADKIGMGVPAALLEIADYAKAKGFSIDVHNVCTFSQVEGVSCGVGVLDVLLACLSPSVKVENGSDFREVPRRLFGWLPITSSGQPL